MITNYYNIPNIPCDKRLELPNNKINNEEKCTGLNPDKIYKTLFPDKNDPLVNYDFYKSKISTAGNFIGEGTEKNETECAQDCSNNNECAYFISGKIKDYCITLKEKNMVKNDDWGAWREQGYNVKAYSKNNLLNDPNINVNDRFAFAGENYFPPESAFANTADTDLYNSYLTNSKDECFSHCLADNNCNSIVYFEGKKNKCLMKNNLTRADFNTTLKDNSDRDYNLSSYFKKEEMMGNQFGINDDMIDYYKTYSISGKEGDSFCKFVENENKCSTSYVVKPINNSLSTKSENPTNTNNNNEQIKENYINSCNSEEDKYENEQIKNYYREIPNLQQASNINSTNIPPPKICMPPNCVPKLPETGLRGKLKVDGSFSIMCPNSNTPDAEECVKSIDKTPFATFDKMGLPTYNDASNPPNGYLPYTMEYDTYNNLEITTSDSISTTNNENNDVRIMNNGEKPSLESMEFPEDCQNWCNKSIDCGAYSYYIGNDGNAKCNYYNNVGMNRLKDRLKPKKDTHTLIKRGNRYVQKPLQGEIKKPYFNDFSTVETDVIKKKVCIQENFTDLYCPFPYNKIRSADTNKIMKDDDIGSNCPTPLVKCKDTRYGCCPDNETAKVNENGSNCPVINKDKCLTSKYGCCPGTIIPMEYLCDQEGNDLCKMTNCELNDNQRGDPYAFYGGKGVKCAHNNACTSGQMCVYGENNVYSKNGTCKFFNKKYYNTLNGGKITALHRESGNSMNDLMCGCSNQPISDTCNNYVYEPVCGDDGKTYRSLCVAEKSGIKVKHYGTCGDDILEKFYNLDDFKMPIKNSRTSYWILLLLLLVLVGSILYCFR